MNWTSEHKGFFNDEYNGKYGSWWHLCLTNTSLNSKFHIYTPPAMYRLCEFEALLEWNNSKIRLKGNDPRELIRLNPKDPTVIVITIGNFRSSLTGLVEFFDGTSNEKTEIQSIIKSALEAHYGDKYSYLIILFGQENHEQYLEAKDQYLRAHLLKLKSFSFIKILQFGLVLIALWFVLYGYITQFNKFIK